MACGLAGACWVRPDGWFVPGLEGLHQMTFGFISVDRKEWLMLVRVASDGSQWLACWSRWPDGADRRSVATDGFLRRWIWIQLHVLAGVGWPETSVGVQRWLDGDRGAMVAQRWGG
ncbi:hypothetical protein RchiOBHm_Chr5g0015991 [Rosa chinensis]|uniref:Uncharacterized protein n=1 Tax=Rosa chinensis TaxID=74649 RepID=A0A2P6Q643_ROSCH|nr:hypothetical protein RchiOBHm_Chr5g0015991 [Rosa chinensis]